MFGILLISGLLICVIVLIASYTKYAEREVFAKKLRIRSLVGMIVFLILIFCIAIVPAGNIAIKDTFGVVEEQPAASGFWLKSPITMFYPMSVKTQELKESASVPSIEGLLVGLDISILYRVEPNKAPEIYRTIGGNYQEIVIQPMLRSAIREVTAKYEAKALYSQGRDLVSADIYNVLADRFKEKGIVLEQVLLRDLVLPKKVIKAIETKLESEQQSQQMQFVLTKETQEAERKKIEAEGIKAAQEIISQSLTTEYLHWYWLQKLNDNPNVVYIATEAGLPLFKTVDNEVKK